MQVRRIYEAMFLVDADWGSNWDQLEQEIGRLMERADAELVYCKKWDERRLAYELDRRKRGLYVLTFFKAGPDRLTGLERDVQLSERILRMLVLQQTKYSEDELRTLAEGDGIVPVRIVPHGMYRGPSGSTGRDRDRNRGRAPEPAAPAEPGASSEPAKAEPVVAEPAAEPGTDETEKP